MDSIEDYEDALIGRRRTHEVINKEDELHRPITAMVTSIRIKNKKKKQTRKQKWEGKQLYVYFKQQIGKIAHEKTWVCLRKENPKRETESLLIIT